ncbi:hypothetical protein K435DRAFT_856920 [Dendrothele bispora CBS 962.96]|uniref:Uncharacterized protein n=1 Tax=Dendrothele bispora (strain CBS 962.96) TaxID=1314807 RepID=A0A4S8M7A0_DENBC|nr:hypothetical protein K435DRAFT_856920 [Dendrothele bispora CBS 962.96]
MVVKVEKVEAVEMGREMVERWGRQWAGEAGIEEECVSGTRREFDIWIASKIVVETMPKSTQVLWYPCPSRDISCELLLSYSSVYQNGHFEPPSLPLFSVLSYISHSILLVFWSSPSTPSPPTNLKCTLIPSTFHSFRYYLSSFRINSSGPHDSRMIESSMGIIGEVALGDGDRDKFDKSDNYKYEYEMVNRSSVEARKKTEVRIPLQMVNWEVMLPTLGGVREGVGGVGVGAGIYSVSSALWKKGVRGR